MTWPASRAITAIASSRPISVRRYAPYSRGHWGEGVKAGSRSAWKPASSPQTGRISRTSRVVARRIWTVISIREQTGNGWNSFPAEANPLMATREPIVQVRDLQKRYGTVTAVTQVNFDVFAGEIFGILGPNGAGKTTTLEMIEGLRRPDGGTAVVDGVDVGSDPRGVRARIGVQLQEAGFFERLTVEETLILFGAFHRRTTDGSRIIARMQLEDKRRAWVSTLSGGQRQRLSIAVALVNDPRIMFLDEPTTGLDPQARRNLWKVIAGFRGEGRTIILTTHYMEEAERLCDRVAIMDYGRIVALDAPRALIRAHAPATTIGVTLTGGEADFAALPGVRRVEQGNGEVLLASTDPMQTVHALMDLNREGTLHFHQLRVEEATLEDVFLHLTGRRLRE